ncbi:single-stranded DNA-binding protein [Agrococcus beijingensis]|uniref:single-stranded DNA-binding protein n=1 Tax=Agrococcus beijingensis TaxID=3068634 RepID=UPI0027407152|nr:single-stranded DNA-binding protein [Agrococcus sp. REN33]
MNDAITVVGSLGGDPALKSVNGDQVAEFRLGCTARRKEGDQWVNGHTNWYSIEAWGKIAPNVVESLRKGDVVMVLGKLKVDQWESGDKRGTSVRIRAEHIGHSLRVGPSRRERRAVDPALEHAGEAEHALPSGEPQRELQLAGQSDWGAPRPDDEPVF